MVGPFAKPNSKSLGPMVPVNALVDVRSEISLYLKVAVLHWQRNSGKLILLTPKKLYRDPPTTKEAMRRTPEVDLTIPSAVGMILVVVASSNFWFRR